MLLICKPLLVYFNTWLYITPRHDIHFVVTTVENAKNMKPVQTCTGFIFCIFPPDVRVQLFKKDMVPRSSRTTYIMHTVELASEIGNHLEDVKVLLHLFFV